MNALKYCHVMLYDKHTPAWFRTVRACFDNYGYGRQYYTYVAMYMYMYVYYVYTSYLMLAMTWFVHV